MILIFSLVIINFLAHWFPIILIVRLPWVQIIYSFHTKFYFLSVNWISNNKHQLLLLPIGPHRSALLFHTSAFRPSFSGMSDFRDFQFHPTWSFVIIIEYFHSILIEFQLFKRVSSCWVMEGNELGQIKLFYGSRKNPIANFPFSSHEEIVLWEVGFWIGFFFHWKKHLK